MANAPEASVPKRVVMWVEKGVVNPLVERILRSPIHGQLGKSIVATTDRNATNWWKNFRDGHPATLWVEGQPVEMTGREELDPAEITDAYTELGYRSGAWRWATRGLGVQPTAPRDERERAATDVVLVVFNASERGFKHGDDRKQGNGR